MAWNNQPRTLAVASDAFPKYFGQDIFEAARLSGVEKLGKLYDYLVDVSTIEASGLYANEMHKYVDVNTLIGKRLCVKIAIEGCDGADEANVGAEVREIIGIISEATCLGSDERRVFYRFRLRPALWLASLNRENRTFRDMDVREISDEILKPYPLSVRWKLLGAFNGHGPYPKRDYQRQFWESDWSYLDRLWQEWGITFYFDGDTLVLMDNQGYPMQGPAYETIRYLERDGQRIDEEHIHKLKYSRGLTTGKVAVIDYDYTRSTARLERTTSNHRDATHDNAEEYVWADYAQPQQGAMGLNAPHNNEEFEADHLATVRSDAHRNKSLRIRAEGNLRGVRAGRQFNLIGHPVAPVNRRYLVVATKLEIVNNDMRTQSGALTREYTCRTRFTAQPSDHVYRTPLKAKKPRAFAEKAVVTGYENKGVLSDAMARIRIWFVWDRVNSRDENASCWVPLAQVWQGQRYGAMWIPRVRDHVYVGYLNSDPDRPFILGSHVTDGNEAPWDLYANHALSGWRSQDLDGMYKGSNMVVTDDTPGQLQVQVASDYANSRLVLGYNTHIDGDKGRQKARGEGFELATEAHGVVRANRGVLVTTEAKSGASAPAKDIPQTVQRLQEASHHHKQLAHLAQQHGAQLSQTDQSEIASTLDAQTNAIKGSLTNEYESFPELGRPDIVLSSASGIAMSASSHTHIASNQNIALTSGSNVAIASEKSFFASIRERLAIFVQKFGIKLIAASGQVDIAAQKGDIEIVANQVLKLISEKKRIEIAAAEEILLHARGSYIRINGAGIEHGTLGNWTAYAASHDFPEQRRLPSEGCFHGMPEPYSNRLDVYDDYWLADFDSVKYIARRASGEVVESGLLDEHGRTARIYTETAEELDLLVGPSGGWLVESSGNGAFESPDAGEEGEHSYVNRNYEVFP
ncbi:type VI secretion system Vgr family protein [Caballeronia grimmiae]|uniref:type VI secretion system Vgr family protein n=1 Tax=Caballeronia grimmiae TaxID=1071679 RepID=UPI0038B88564